MKSVLIHSVHDGDRPVKVNRALKVKALLAPTQFVQNTHMPLQAEVIAQLKNLDDEMLKLKKEYEKKVLELSKPAEEKWAKMFEERNVFLQKGILAC